MNLQQTLKSLIFEHNSVRVPVRRRIHKVQNHLQYEMDFVEKNGLTCRFNNIDSYTDYIIDETILRLYHGFFTDKFSDDFSEEWDLASQYIEKYIRENHLDTIHNFYHSVCR